jgi:hypothetical protein
MPKPPREYKAHIMCPTEAVFFQLPSGESTSYQIWRDDALDQELIQCDLCQQLLPLTRNRSTIQLQKHRSSKECQKAVRRLENAMEKESRLSRDQGLVFVNAFQEAGGASTGFGVPLISF